MRTHGLEADSAQVPGRQDARRLLPLLVTEGLDGLADRVKEYVGLGAKFAKWRAVIEPGGKLPSYDAILANAHALARYAATQQSQEQLNSFRSLMATLTPREAEVFAWMVRGKLNKQIAHLLGTSERTIKAHRHMVMHKLQVHSFADPLRSPPSGGGEPPVG